MYPRLEHLKDAIKKYSTDLVSTPYTGRVKGVMHNKSASNAERIIARSITLLALGARHICLVSDSEAENPDVLRPGIVGVRRIMVDYGHAVYRVHPVPPQVWRASPPRVPTNPNFLFFFLVAFRDRYYKYRLPWRLTSGSNNENKNVMERVVTMRRNPRIPAGSKRRL